MNNLNENQFLTLADLMRLRKGSLNYDYARRALVNGESAPDIARDVATVNDLDFKLTYTNVWRAVKNAQAFVKKCKAVCGIGS